MTEFSMMNFSIMGEDEIIDTIRIYCKPLMQFINDSIGPYDSNYVFMHQLKDFLVKWYGYNINIKSVTEVCQFIMDNSKDIKQRIKIEKNLEKL